MEDSTVMDLSPDVQAIIRRRLVPEIADSFLALARPSVGFTVRAEASVSGSMIGGAPRTGPFVWPVYREAPMLLLAQVDCAQMASILGAEWSFPRQGYLLFFHDEEFSATYDYEQGDDGCQVLHLPAGSGAEAAVTMPALPLDATLMPSLPDLRDDADKALGIHIVELIDLLEELRPLSPASRHRLLGYCDTDTSHPPGHRPLLQVEAEPGTAWGEVVNVSFWIPDADLRAGRLDRVRRCYEVA
ncbi:DUF1963 domain-containing protein [Micromonospora sp. 15K316]|uniref:DUF1963 domain-containing protein n=1 Tax=Micromonospora sp. 15K316 TaxID=2530376 RepID=UPI001404C130|nr:DUF1963 domain-containing protein [Micromonospora sp. 15K316]